MQQYKAYQWTQAVELLSSGSLDLFPDVWINILNFNPLEYCPFYICLLDDIAGDSLHRVKKRLTNNNL